MTALGEFSAPAVRSAAPTVLEATDLVKLYSRRSARGSSLVPTREVVRAVDGVSLSLQAGRVTALIGESGSGKSTVSRLLSLLEWPSSGTVTLNGQTVVSGGVSSLARSRAQRRHAADVQLVFQDPFASLNANHTVKYHIERPLRLHHDKLGRHLDIKSRVVELLEQVSLRPGATYAARYPHELSGGQRQRVAIARALASEPSVLLADEPVSMLDVSVRLGVLSLLDDLRRQRNLGVLYITHDLASASYFADEVTVMYAGRLVEGGPAAEVIQHPAHPYTRLLREAAPDPDRLERPILGDVGEPPSLANPPSGCRFHPRCPHAMDICRSEQPPMLPVGPGHWASCWLYRDQPGPSAAPSAGAATVPGSSPAGRPPSGPAHPTAGGV
jgi:peptide/nickel transport system ATP-binding protein